MRRCSSCNEPMRDTDDHCLACEQWDLAFEAQREMMDDHDTRYMDFYDTQHGDIGDVEFFDYEPSPYDGTYSEE